MNKPPSRRKTTKSVAIRRPDTEPESSRGRELAETAPPPRERKPTVPDMPRARKTTKDVKAQQGAETARPRRDTRGEANGAETARPRRDTRGEGNSAPPPPSRRDSKAAAGKRASAPPRRRDSKEPKISTLEAEAAATLTLPVDKHAPFRVSGDLPDPEATRYSVIPSPRSTKKKR